MEHGDNLLTIRNLHTYFYTEDGIVKALNGVNLDLRHGECLGLVGESGSGKSVTALSILRLIQEPPGKIVEGQIVFEGEDLLTLSTERMCEEVRGGQIAMIFQDPMTSLNPAFRVGTQVGEAIKIHQHVGWKEALRRAIEMGVMYAGNIVAYTDADTLFNAAKYPYTQGLLHCFPEATERKTELEPIEGIVPNLINPPSGCRFHPRCKMAMPICAEREPQLKAIAPGHQVSCLLYEDAVQMASATPS